MFPQSTAAQRLYNQLMQQSFQLGPKQETLLRAYETGGYPFVTAFDVFMSSEGIRTHMVMLYNCHSFKDIAAAIRSAPQDFFTESI